jgi:zinc transport system substrate-binding protein
MAGNTADALARADPAHAADFQRRLDGVLNAIDKANARARAKLAPYRGRAVYVFHPAFSYYCDAYGLKQRAVEIDGHEPSSRQLRELVRQAKNDGVRTIFVQQQFDHHGADVVARAIGGRVAVLDPLAEDAVANLERIAQAIASGWNGK